MNDATSITPFICVIAGGVVTFGAERFGADVVRFILQFIHI